MLNKHVFKANRGEGKTKWLVDRAIEYYDHATYHYYLGSKSSYDNFCAQYEAEMHKKCPIQYWPSNEIMYPVGYMILYSDELLEAFNYFPVISNAIEGEWFMTISGENFIS